MPLVSFTVEGLPILVTLSLLRDSSEPCYFPYKRMKSPLIQNCVLWELSNLTTLSIQQIFTGLHAKTEGKREEDIIFNSRQPVSKVKRHDLLMHYTVRLSNVKQGMTKHSTGVRAEGCIKIPHITLVTAFTSLQRCTSFGFSQIIVTSSLIMTVKIMTMMEHKPESTHPVWMGDLNIHSVPWRERSVL